MLQVVGVIKPHGEREGRLRRTKRLRVPRKAILAPSQPCSVMIPSPNCTVVTSKAGRPSQQDWTDLSAPHHPNQDPK